MSAKEARPRVLLVEDDEPVGRGVVDYLDRRGFDVEHVATMSAARKALSACEFAVVILDWMLPDGEGIDLVRGSSCVTPRCPVIFLTARIELADRVVGLEVGADDYIMKPFEPRELLARLHVQLRRRVSSRLHCAAPSPSTLRRARRGIEARRSS